MTQHGAHAITLLGVFVEGGGDIEQRHRSLEKALASRGEHSVCLYREIIARFKIPYMVRVARAFVSARFGAAVCSSA